MEVADNYRWEALKSDGTIFSDGNDLSAVLKFSLIPVIEGLPRYDIAGVPLIRRFGRGFIRVSGSRPDDYVQCVIGKGFRLYVDCSNGNARVTPQDFELYL